MSIIVQKYGGSSVADLGKLRQVAERVVATAEAGHRVVVVVSAMGNTTNELLELARRVSPRPSRREVDMLISVGERIAMALLSMAIQDLGRPAISFTGSQSGIITDESHSSARIVAVRPGRLASALEKDQIVIVAGFQGVSRSKEVTTLGRGGTDLTAVALAAALGAAWCEICSDVDGVYSADPRVVPEAVRLDTMSLDEALTQAAHGARVLYSEAVAYAHRMGIELVASATTGPSAGTRIQVPPLPPRVAAITADAQLEAFRSVDPASFLAALAASGVRVRGLQRDSHEATVIVDLRNWHDREAFVVPEGSMSLGRTAVVAAVGSGVELEPRDWLAAESALQAAGVEILASEGRGGAMSWRVPPEQLDAAQRALHAALIEGN
ncbi:MAG: aspartate kinase [Alphaproteobacteria bacterium]|nr:aspartate kinase [Alphaproteobacteria bacterium]